jgi:nicotinate-nucleotide adenylyltransferase
MATLCVRSATCQPNAAKECRLKGREKSKQRIGIYAGAFDPVHDGHIAFAKTAIAKAGLDRVYLLAEPRPRHKQGVKALEHRMAMIEHAIARESGLGQIVLDQARFTAHETWPLLESRFAGAQLFMLMGEDIFKRLIHWPRIDELVTSAHFIVGLRDGHDETDLRTHLGVLEQTKALDLHYDIFRVSPPVYDSRQIRATLRSGKVPKGLHPDVLTYIEAHQLYSSVLTA